MDVNNRIVLCLQRHTESEETVWKEKSKDNIQYVIYPEQFHSDNPAISLTKRGIEQAQDIGYNWRESGVEFDLVFSSSYRRAQQTAEEIQKSYGKDLQIQLSDQLVERSEGEFTGRSKVQTQILFPDEMKKRQELGRFDYRPPNGESFADLCEGRVKSFLNSLLVGNSYKRILLITHSSIIRSIIMLLDPKAQTVDRKKYYDTMPRPKVAAFYQLELVLNGEEWLAEKIETALTCDEIIGLLSERNRYYIIREKLESVRAHAKGCVKCAIKFRWWRDRLNDDD